MSLKVHVNFNKKAGLPDYGSVGAACGLELELDHSLLVSDPDGLQARIRQAYAACSQAVEEELARHCDPVSEPQPATAPASRTTAAARPTPQRNGNGNGHQATTKQLDYAKQLAGQIDGLGVRKLETLAQKMFSKPVAGLTSLDASGLIDCLKAIKAGEINLTAALGGAAI